MGCVLVPVHRGKKFSQGILASVWGRFQPSTVRNLGSYGGTKFWLREPAIMAGGLHMLTTCHPYIGCMIVPPLCLRTCGHEASSQLVSLGPSRVLRIYLMSKKDMCNQYLILVNYQIII